MVSRKTAPWRQQRRARPGAPHTAPTSGACCRCRWQGSSCWSAAGQGCEWREPIRCAGQTGIDSPRERSSLGKTMSRHRSAFSLASACNAMIEDRQSAWGLPAPRHSATSTDAAMTDLSAEYKALAEYRPKHKVRFVTAAVAVRRPRRGDQHHAAHPAGHGRRGDPPRPQPLGRRSRHRRAAGRRAGHRHQHLPGRPRRVLQVHGRPAEARAAARTSRSSAAAAA